MPAADDAPHPRLCHIRKRPDFAGYGFNLHAEKGRAGQFIGKVDEGSPAAEAGLKEGDRIVEVNGTNVANENHQQVVERIKAVEHETKFLVVDSETDDYYRERNVVISGDMESVVVIVSSGPRLEEKDEVKENGDAKSSHGSHDDEDHSTHKARLCVMRIWDDFPGYGFNLHAEKGKSAQFIGKVDENSPAEAAGLKEGDRIIEVNGSCVLSETHQEVVKKIKSDPKQVTMLLVDPEAERYFNGRGVSIASSMDGVERIECPLINPHVTAPAAAPVVAALSVASAGKDDFGEYKIRLCNVKAGDKGFGFNMQTEKGQPGQFIGTVDDDSPAERAGLRKGDRIIEVNGETVEGCSHKQVVEKIRAKPGETTLLVVDQDADKFFTEKSIKLTAALACVVKLESGLDNGVAEKKPEEENNYYSVADEIAAVAKKEEKEDEKKKAAEEKPALKLNVEATSSTSNSNNNNNTASSPTKSVESPRSPVVINGIEFSASVEEAKRRASTKKRTSVKENNMSMKDKYAMFQKL